jgi:hypothetical protein
VIILYIGGQGNGQEAMVQKSQDGSAKTVPFWTGAKDEQKWRVLRTNAAPLVIPCALLCNRQPSLRLRS